LKPMRGTWSGGRRARRTLQALLLVWAAATLACQAVFVDDPTPVQPLHHPSQPATGSPAPTTPAPPTATPRATLPPLTTPAEQPSLVVPTLAPPPGANYQAQSGDTLASLALRFRADPGYILQ